MGNDIPIPEEAMTEGAWAILIPWAHGEATQESEENRESED